MRSLFFVLLFTISSFASNEVILQLKWLHQFQFAGYYMAKEKGFYEEVGIDVEIRQRDLKYNNIEQVINNEAQYGVADSVLLLYRAKKEPLKIVAPIFQHSPSVLLTLKSSGIDSPYKLQGKNMTYYSKDTDGFGILAMLEVLDIKPNINRNKDTTTHEHLIEGKTEAYPVYLTNEPYYFKKAGIDVNIINPSNYGVDLYGDILFTNELESTQNPKRVQKFKEATIKGWQYALDNIAESVKIIHQKYATNKSIEHLTYEAHALEQIIQHKTIPIGTLDVGRIDYAIKFYEKFGLIASNIPIDEYIFKPVSPLNGANMGIFSKEEKEYLQNKQAIKMCIDPNWMPFEKNDNGKHIGMSADYINIFEKIIDIDIQMVDTRSWLESLEFGKQRKCDIFSLVMPTKQRREFLDFTLPYIVDPIVIATDIKELFINDIKSVLNKKVGIVGGYAFVEILKDKYPNINLVEVKNVQEGLKKLSDGELFGFIGALATIGFHIQKDYIGQLKIAGKLDEKLEVGIGVRNDESILRDIFNKAIAQLTDDQKHYILNRWISVNYSKDIDYAVFIKWLGFVVLFFVIIILIFIRANRNLNIEITNRKKIEQKLQRYLDIVDRYVITSSTDLDGHITEVSTAFCEISGYSQDELIGRKHSIIKSHDTTDEFYKKLWRELLLNNKWSGEIKNRAKDGSFYWIYANITAVYNEQNEKVGYTAIRQDITSKKRLEEISITDELTQIYNRRYFNEVLPNMVNIAKREDIFLSFCIMDIDYFKLYNDTYGHLMGDEALKSVSKALKESLHRADDYCFRIGGEEFGILFKTKSKEDAQELVESIKDAILALKLPHEKNPIGYMSASFGLAIVDPKELESENELYKLADELLYEAKDSGRNKVVVN